MAPSLSARDFDGEPEETKYWAAELCLRSHDVYGMPEWSDVFLGPPESSADAWPGPQECRTSPALPPTLGWSERLAAPGCSPLRNG